MASYEITLKVRVPDMLDQEHALETANELKEILEAKRWALRPFNVHDSSVSLVSNK